MSATAIEWTEVTWNPTTGCSKTSTGCRNCYAERMARRLQAMGQPNYHDGFSVRTHEHMLALPGRWRKPRMVFVNSMGDVFHEDVPLSFIRRIFGVMEANPRHTFQVLTKRAERLRLLAPRLAWPANVWIGVTAEDNDRLDRLDALRSVPAAVRFVSLEPLLGPVPDLSLEHVDWVIAGGESGPGARPVSEEWVLEVRDRCVEVAVPFFFKQWGGTCKKRAGRELQGRVWSQAPVAD